MKRALAVAEQFALAGKRVLVLLTDMTNYADAQKEMAITMEQVPSNRGYPVPPSPESFPLPSTGVPFLIRPLTRMASNSISLHYRVL